MYVYNVKSDKITLKDLKFTKYKYLFTKVS